MGELVLSARGAKLLMDAPQQHELHPLTLMPPKAKTSSTDRIIYSCGCGDTVSRRMQTRHLQGHGPLMAVAGIIETRAYFHE